MCSRLLLIALMAQIGDCIRQGCRTGGGCYFFTRVGASDEFGSKGSLPFMVEMTEVAEILQYATQESCDS